ncbi:lipase/esterase [Rhodopirellula sallentina SM41]|uniref:Lipase/esterase n=1 Tax=Rhodopirellula sallentina SM41 TaxID=1263870 RepID=M5UIA1_9BACT|nr:lipase/esterase [Rhodopirellula sallentina SM41]
MSLSAQLVAEEPPTAEIKTFWDIRYSPSPELQEGKSGLADLYVPILADDVVGRGDNADDHESDTASVSTSASAPPEDSLPTDESTDQPANEPADDRQEPAAGAANCPISVTGKLRPAVVLVHGGGWLVGDKWSLGSYSRQLSELGICVLNINYRLAPYSKFPAPVDDVREALLYLVDHAEQLSIDRERIGLFGYSAGGHLSALVGVMCDEPGEVQATSSEWEIDDPRWKRLPKVAAVCAGGPPCDLREVPIDSEALSFFLRGSRRKYPDAYVAASPTAHASPGDPPTQLIHGEKDMIVPIESSQQFADALKDAGASVALTVVENQGHFMTFMHPSTQTQVRAFFVEQFLKLAP